MKIRYTKRFSKDLDGIIHDADLKKRLLDVLEKITADGFTGRYEQCTKNSGLRGIFSDSHRRLSLGY
jgi:mRNA-degrading endonuclease YafQ of YafQ-DinJ toxin-antitoxin module